MATIVGMITTRKEKAAIPSSGVDSDQTVVGGNVSIGSKPRRKQHLWASKGNGAQ